MVYHQLKSQSCAIFQLHGVHQIFHLHVIFVISKSKFKNYACISLKQCTKKLNDELLLNYRNRDDDLEYRREDQSTDTSR